MQLYGFARELQKDQSEVQVGRGHINTEGIWDEWIGSQVTSTIDETEA